MPTGARRAGGAGPPAAAQAIPQAIRDFRAGRATRAIKTLKRHLKAVPGDAEAWRVLGEIQSRADDGRSAVRSLERAVALAPSAAARNLLGMALVKEQRLGEAEALFRQNLGGDGGSDGDNVEALANLAACLRLQGRLLAARRALTRAQAMASKDVGLVLDLGQVLLAAGRYDEAAESFARADGLRPGELRCRIPLANALARAGRGEEALATSEATLRGFADLAAAHNAAGDLLQGLGRLREAEAAYRRALELEPENAFALLALAGLAGAEAREALETAMTALLGDKGTAAQDRALLGFALGSLEERAGSHDQAFARFREANRLVRREQAFDIEATAAEFAAIERAFDSLPAPAPVKGSERPRPIFIIGMPRSGTTLIEQILASHPQVAAGGELPLMRQLERDLRDLLGTEAAFPEAITALSSAEMARCREAYLEAARPLAGERAFLTDKSPFNFRSLGWIVAAFPDAVIVHCLREPLDICLSCYCRRFGAGRAAFAYDLEELGRYYRLYEDLMAHWRRLLGGRLFEIAYEDLVARQEPASRRLLDHCGLPWDPAVLDFQRAGHAVMTASALQVREPIYDTSVARWRRYESHLGPLMQALGEPTPGE